MDKRDFVKRLYAGLFFIIGLVLIFVVVIAIGMEKGFTQPKIQMNVLFRDVGGLSVGAPVRLSGVTVGTVDNIDFLEEQVHGRSVNVKLNIFKRYTRQIEKGGRFAIKTEGILGEKLVDITSDTARERRNLSEPVFGQDPLDVQDLAETFGETAVALKETSVVIDEMIEELRGIALTSKRLINRIEERLIDGTLFRIF